MAGQEGANAVTVRVTDDGLPTNLFATQSFTVTVAATPRVTAGLQALYTFDAGSGDTVFDVSGVGTPIDLTIADSANVSWGSGSLSVNASTLIASAGAATKLNTAIPVNDAITLEAWVTPANTTQTGPARIVTLSPDPANANFTLGQGASGGIPGTLYDVRLRTTTTGNAGHNPSLSSPPGSLSTTLTHMVYARDAAGNAAIYINDVLVANGTIGGNLSNWGSGYGLTLANVQTGDRPWLGSYDLVAIYDRALSAAEVSQNFSAGSSGSE